MSQERAPRVLVAEDDRALVGLLTMTLTSDGCEVHTAYDGETALRRHADEWPDVVILDLNLPDLSGEEVCRRIRATSGTPILVLSGRSEEEDVARLLELGADDYVRKPFGRRELLARVRAAARRAPRPGPRQIRVDGLVIDLARHRVLFDARPLKVTPIEFRILERLASAQGSVVAHADLLAAAWPDGAPDGSWLKPHVARLRRKLELVGARVPQSVRGVGYRLA